MHTTIAFSESIAPGGAWDNLAAVVDPHIHTEGDMCYISDMNRIIGEKALTGTGADQCRLQSPSIRRINPYYINQLEAALVQAGNVERTFHPNKVVTLVPDEGLECEVNSAPAGAEVQTVIVFLAGGGITPVEGEVNVVHFTTTVVLAASTWVYAEIALVDDLPVGVYDVVGGRLEQSTAIAFRFVPVGGMQRPGGMCVPGAAYQEDPQQRFGGLGVWFTFNSVQLPGIEVIDSAATGSTTMDGYMDVIRRS